MEKSNKKNIQNNEVNSSFDIQKIETKRKLNENETIIFMKAIRNDDNEKAKELLNIMDDVNEYLHCGCTPLTLSCVYGRMEIVKYLIDLGIDVNITDENKESPLMNAISCGNIEMVGILIDAGANVNFTNNYGHSALCKAVYYNNLNIFELLILSGASVDICGGKALLCASANENMNIVKRLIDLNVDVNYVDSHGYSALHYACNNDRLSVVEFLLSNGANENIQNRNGKTPIERTENEEIKEFINNYNSTKFVLK